MTASSRFASFHLPMLKAGALVALLIVTPGVKGQTGPEVTVSKVDAQLVYAPAINYTGAPAKPVPQKKWAEIETTFAWQPANPSEKYTDDLVVNYYVLLNNKSSQAPQGTLLAGQTSLASIPARSLDSRNGDLRTVIYISPRTLERLFGGKPPSDINSAISDIGVTFSKQGQVVAQRSLKGSTQAWWPQIQASTGLLLNKADTPFAPLNWDYYETVRKP